MFTYLQSQIDSLKSANEPDELLIKVYAFTSQTYSYVKDYRNAYKYIDTLTELQREVSGLPLLTKAIYENNAGYFLEFLSQNKASQRHYDQALQYIRSAESTEKPSAFIGEMLLIILNNAAFAATYNQDFARADLLSNQFSTYYTFYRDSLIASLSDQYLVENIMARGFNLQKQEKFAEARFVYDEAFALRFSTGQTPNTASNLKIIQGNYANSYVEEGRYTNAEPLARQLLAQALEDAPNSHELSTKAMSNFGYLMNTLVGLNEYEEIDGLLNEAVTLRYTIDSTQKGRKIGLLYTFAAQAANNQNNLSRADSLFALARYAFVGNAQPLGPAQLPKIQGNLIYGQEEFLYFLSTYRDAFIHRTDNGNDQALPLALATARTIDSLLYRGNSQLSLLSSVGRFLGLENRHFAKGIDVALRLYNETNNENYLHEAFGFASRQKSNLLRRYLTGPQLAESFSVPQETIDRKIALETEILITEQALGEATEQNAAGLRNELLSAQQQLAELRLDIKRDHPGFYRALSGAATVDAREAMASLSANQLVVEYFLSADSLYLFTLGNDRVDYAVLPRPANLEQTVGNAFQPDVATELYDLLVAPALAGRTGITRLQLIPDGMLWEVPFAALRVDGEYLFRRQAVSYAYSSPLLFSPSNVPLPGGGYLGIGISYENLVQKIKASANRSATDETLRSMGPLPYATQEVENVRNLMGGTVQRDATATRSNFLSEAANADILHLAVHGILDDDNPMESALVFRGDGDKLYDLLRMRDVLGTRLPKELTVLSACHSGQGPVQTAEGMQSVGLAFTAAGSRSTITSMWAAADRATSEILTETFTLMEDGAYKDVALQQAMIRYFDAGTTADRQPRKWAHLVVTGSLEPLGGQGLGTMGWVLICIGVLLGVALLLSFIRARPQVR